MSTQKTGATSITIKFESAGCKTYLKDVSNLIIGNMVQPGTTNFWSKIPPPNGTPASDTWTWVNTGTNLTAFGLMGNYQYSGTETTALSMIVIDPTKLPPGNYNVLVTLHTAEIGTGNNILMFEKATVNGAPNKSVYTTTYPGQPNATFYNCK